MTDKPILLSAVYNETGKLLRWTDAIYSPDDNGWYLQQNSEDASLTSSDIFGSLDEARKAFKNKEFSWDD